MGVCYSIVNRTKQETIEFSHVGAGKARELAGNPASAAIVTWYLLHHRGDEIAFVGDDGDWPFTCGSVEETFSWPDVTEQVINELLHESILQEGELRWQDPDDPELYIRGFQNIFGEYAPHPSKAYQP